MKRTRVLVAEDSLTIRRHIVETLAACSDLEVVGEAGDGAQAIQLTGALRPDVITLDLVMPGVDGLAATEAIMAHMPTPILIVSASHNRGELFKTYDALAAGAVDALDKCEGDPHWQARLVAAVRMVARIKVITHHRGRAAARAQALTPAPVPALGRATELIAIGASTGGPGALVQLLSALPADFAIPIVIVLHIDASYAERLADWLGDQVRRDVQLARAAPLAPGIVVAPPGRHLVVSGGALRFSMLPERNHCRPSIDVLFESIAAELGPRAAACLLTGMGRDGARGLLAIRQAGGLTIAQDEATSVVYGMPREAAVCGAATHVLPLGDIGPTLKGLGTSR